MKHILYISLSLMLFSSCAKTEGTGGKSTVTGTINQEIWRVGSMGLENQGEFGAQAVDVFVIYGADQGYFHDKIETGYNGKFEIPYLRPGDYSIYVYSECWSCQSGTDSVVKVDFNIPKKKTELELDPILILNK